MLPYPEMVSDILHKVTDETSIQFSVKCRLGYFSAEELFELIPLFNKFKISELTIHPRIGKQLYTGIPDKDTFQRAISLLTIPLIYNGDIFSKPDFQTLNTRFSTIDTWMIGRGILSDPFLPASIKNLPVPVDRQAHIKRFIEALYFAYRKQKNDNLAVLGNLKEFWNYLSGSFNDPHRVFRHIKKVQNFEDYENAVAFIFNEFEWMGSEKDNTL